MRKNTNQEQIEGRIYQHNLQEKITGETSKHPGTPFIAGTIDVATDEQGLNILTVHYTYVTETTKSGNKNASYANLKRIIDNGKTIVNDGIDNAWKVRLTPSIALNDFYPQGQDELVSQPRNEGGFVSIVTELHPEGIERNKFTADVLINKVDHIDADAEKGITEDFVRMNCAVFNFRNDILPFTFVAKNKDAMKYFEGLELPCYTKVWGKIVSSTQIVEHKTESAFGGDAVDTTEKRVREWVVTGAQKEPYEFGEENVMTADEVKEALANRNVMLAENKKRSEEYYAKNGATSTSSKTDAAVPSGGFNF